MKSNQDNKAKKQPDTDTNVGIKSNQDVTARKRVSLRTYDPRLSHYRSDGLEFVLNCWNCHRVFTVWIGTGNLHCSLFGCPNCKKLNEID